jgi:hypothetical protein
MLDFSITFLKWFKCLITIKSKSSVKLHHTLNDMAGCLEESQLWQKKWNVEGINYRCVNVSPNIFPIIYLLINNLLLQ